MTTIELVSIIRKRGQPTRYILMVDDEPVTIQYKVPKTCTYNVVHTPSDNIKTYSINHPRYKYPE